MSVRKTSSPTIIDCFTEEEDKSRIFSGLLENTGKVPAMMGEIIIPTPIAPIAEKCKKGRLYRPLFMIKNLTKKFLYFSNEILAVTTFFLIYEEKKARNLESSIANFSIGFLAKKECFVSIG